MGATNELQRLKISEAASFSLSYSHGPSHLELVSPQSGSTRHGALSTAATFSLALLDAGEGNYWGPDFFKLTWSSSSTCLALDTKTTQWRSSRSLMALTLLGWHMLCTDFVRSLDRIRYDSKSQARRPHGPAGSSLCLFTISVSTGCFPPPAPRGTRFPAYDSYASPAFLSRSSSLLSPSSSVTPSVGFSLLKPSSQLATTLLIAASATLTPLRTLASSVSPGT